MMRLAALALIAMLPLPAVAQQAATTTAPAQAAFSLPKLPYAFDALAPVIDAETMQLHHGKHHQSYVDNLNKAIAADKALQGQSLEALMANVSKLPASVRNNGGGHWNHSFFWPLMAPKGQGGQPSAELMAALTKQFGGLDQFKKAFDAAAAARFGSGWGWLVMRPDGTLAITTTPNQDNPLMDVADVKGTPILGNDVWEHAYYLSYRNRRGEYLNNWWQVVNWNQINRNYAAAVAARK